MKLILILLILILSIINIINCQNSLKVSDIKIGQTHVIPIEGKIWEIKNKTFTLYVTPNRDSLLLAKFEIQESPRIYGVEVIIDDKSIGSLIMNDPSKLPPTEANGTRYSTVHHSIKLPAEWVKNNMKLRFFSDYLEFSQLFDVNVGQYNKLKMWTLPWYLFGANETNTISFESAKSINSSVKAELFQKWSISEFTFLNHPLQRIDWPYLVMGPVGNLSAFVMTGAEQRAPYKDDLIILKQGYSLMSTIRYAFGEATSAIQFYSSFILLNSNGKQASTGGGWGGDSKGTGDHLFKDIFFHEQGHAFGLPHAGEDWARGGNYPYANGSLKGSEWGYDANHNEFLSTFIPTTAGHYPNCQTKRVIDDQGRCVKQSIMQGGDGGKSPGYFYSMVADFEETTIQNWFRNGFYYNEQTGKYQKYNMTSRQYYDVVPIPIRDGGVYSASLDEATPIERNVDIYTIIFTISHVGPSNLTQIYPILKSKGNLLRQFDPTNKTDLATITPRKGKIPYYCDYSGCDYTIRVTYEDNSIAHTLLKLGKRIPWNPSGAFKPNLLDPLSGDSFIQNAINVRGEKRIVKVDLLDTPTAFNGISNNPTIITSRSIL